MSKLEPKTLGTSQVTLADGKIVEMYDLTIPATDVFGYVEANRKSIEAFKDHSLQYSFEYLVTRGKAEVTRQVKAQAERERQQASDAVLKEFNLSPKDAKDLLARFIAEQQAKAAQAKKTA